MNESTVIDRCFEPLTLNLSLEAYRRVPRNAAYKYEYFDGAARLTPRPKPRHARISTGAAIDAEAESPIDGMRLRALADDDRERLADPFAAAFAHVAPFGSLDEEYRREAAAEAIADTLDGRDGPLVESACRVAADATGRPFGACLVTRSRRASRGLESMLDQPHLTWLFVAPLAGRRGVGSALLVDALERLRAEGWPALFTTFLVGNEASTMWHWERGFELLANPYSLRGHRGRRAAGA